MQKLSFICFFLIVKSLSFAQSISFDFENSDLSGWHQSESGHWDSDTISPIEGNASLHHNYDNQVAGTEFISVGHKQIYLDSANTSWQFAVKYNYNPSASNNWSIWLINNVGEGEQNPGVNSNAYILGVNYQGSDDLLKLWKKSSEGIEIVLATDFNWQEEVLSGEEIWLRMERAADGLWNISVDTLGTAGWIAVGSANDNKFIDISYFGVYYKYTSTQDRKLWIDDIRISGKFYEDIYPPAIDTFKLIDRNSLHINFTESIDTLSPITILLNEQVSSPEMIWEGNQELILKFQTIFSSQNNLEIKNLSDIKRNISNILRFDFNYYQPQQYDILVTEILADPTPAVSLPECEYIEILNRSANNYNVKGWKLYIDENAVEFPDIILKSGEYYIITKSSCTDLFNSLINIIEFSSLPALINTGSLLQIKDRYGKRIDALEYSDTWYKTDEKSEGGWSLEIIDVDQPCTGADNWSESKASAGGTPGLSNSVATFNIDDLAPIVSKVEVLDSTTLIVKFSEAMDSLSLAAQNNFVLLEEEVTPVFSEPVSPFFRETYLKFANTFTTGKIYYLDYLEQTISDCSGNYLNAQPWQFGISELPDSGNILINEILYEAGDNIPEFFEIYNNSSKVIDLHNMHAALIDEFSGEIKNDIVLCGDYFQLFPGSYLAITEDKPRLLFAFSEVNEKLVIEPPTWLTLSNDGGRLVLLDGEENFIDIAVFNTDMQFDLLTETAGVSLERISFQKPGDHESSWHSAAENAGFATPARENSQLVAYNEGNGNIRIEPDEISPDNDGINDILTITYTFDEPGFTLSAWVFSQSGSEVRELANNELCSISGTIIWDGLDSSGGRLPMGYYILFLEAIHPSGEIIREKKAVLVLPEKK